MTEEIIIDKENKTKKHRNNEIDCLHFGCRKGENGNVLFWCDFYDDYCDNYTGCYYRKYLRLEQENRKLKAYKDVNKDFKKAWDELNKKYTEVLKLAKENADSNEYCLQELEKKNFALTQESQQKSQTICELEQENKELKEKVDKEEYNACCECTNIQNQNDVYRSVLKEIREMAKIGNAIDGIRLKIIDKINEVLGDEKMS